MPRVIVLASKLFARRLILVEQYYTNYLERCETPGKKGTSAALTNRNSSVQQMEGSSLAIQVETPTACGFPATRSWRSASYLRAISSQPKTFSDRSRARIARPLRSSAFPIR
jgi:hypothetical protein